MLKKKAQATSTEPRISPNIIIVDAGPRYADADGIARTVSRPVPSRASGTRVFSFSS